MPRKLTPKNAMDFCRDEREFLEWLDSRPPQVRALAGEFPIGTVITDGEGDDWYVIGWDEADCLIISPCWIDDYDAAMSGRRKAHAKHLRDGEAPFMLYLPDGTPDIKIEPL